MRLGILVCGPSGVGKSSHIKEITKEAPVFLIDPDKLEGSHTEQSKKAMELVEESIQDKKSFVFVGTCGGMQIIKSLLKKMKKNTFKTVVAIVYTSLPNALKRIKDRPEQPVTEDVTKDLHAFFKTKAERYMNLADIDELYLYSNETDFKLLLSKKKKKIVCQSSDSEFYFDISKYC